MVQMHADSLMPPMLAGDSAAERHTTRSLTSERMQKRALIYAHLGGDSKDDVERDGAPRCARQHEGSGHSAHVAREQRHCSGWAVQTV